MDMILVPTQEIKDNCGAIYLASRLINISIHQSQELQLGDIYIALTQPDRYYGGWEGATSVNSRMSLSGNCCYISGPNIMGQMHS